jgi:hypothetical protein
VSLQPSHGGWEGWPVGHSVAADREPTKRREGRRPWPAAAGEGM